MFREKSSALLPQTVCDESSRLEQYRHVYVSKHIFVLNVTHKDKFLSYNFYAPLLQNQRLSKQQSNGSTNLPFVGAVSFM